MNWRLHEERNGIMQELQHITKELEQVSSELSGIQGTGLEHCSSRLMDVSDKYKRIGIRLQNRF